MPASTFDHPTTSRCRCPPDPVSRNGASRLTARRSQRIVHAGTKQLVTGDAGVTPGCRPCHRGGRRCRCGSVDVSAVTSSHSAVPAHLAGGFRPGSRRRTHYRWRPRAPRTLRRCRCRGPRRGHNGDLVPSSGLLLAGRRCGIVRPDREIGRRRSRFWPTAGIVHGRLPRPVAAGLGVRRQTNAALSHRGAVPAQRAGEPSQRAARSARSCWRSLRAANNHRAPATAEIAQYRMKRRTKTNQDRCA